MLHCTSQCTSRGELRLSAEFLHHKVAKGSKNQDSSWRARSIMHPDSSQSESDADRRSLLGDIERIKTRTGGYPDKKPLSKVQGAVQETIGWLRHAIQDPEDFSSAAIGRMVSKEYGKHEPPHTEHHMWRTGHTPRPSPPSSPVARNQQQQTCSAPATPTGTSAASGGMSPTFAAIAKTVGAAAAPAGPVGLEPVRDAKGSGGGGNMAQVLGSGGGNRAAQQATGPATLLPEQRDTSNM